MKNKLFLLLSVLGTLHYSLAEKGGISFFLWPKFLKKTLPNNTLPNNNTLPPYLASPESQKSDREPSSLARPLEEFPGPHSYFLQPNLPLEAEKEKKEAGHEEMVGQVRKKMKKKVKTQETKNFPLDAYKRSEEAERKRKKAEIIKRLILEAYKKRKEEERKRKEAEKKARAEKFKRLFLLGAEKKRKEEEGKRKEAEKKARAEKFKRLFLLGAEKKRKEEEGKRREEEARKRKEEEECKRKEEEECKRKEEEARKRKEEEEHKREEERKQKEKEARKRKEAEEHQRKEEEARKRKEEEERKRKEKEERKRKAEEARKRKEAEERKWREEEERKLKEAEERESEKELIEEKLKLSSSFEKEGREHEYPFAPLFSSFPSSFEKEYGDLSTLPFSSSAPIFVSENQYFSNIWHISALSASLSSSGEETCFGRPGSDIGDIIDGDFSDSPLVYTSDNEGMDKEAEESKEEEEKGIGIERFLKMQEVITKISEDLQAEERVHLLKVQDKTKPVQLVAQHYEALLDSTEKLKWINNDKFTNLERRIRVSMRDMQLEYGEELKDNTCFLKNRGFANRQAYRGYNLSIPELYENLLENAQTLAEYCRQQYEKNHTIQVQLTYRIDGQEKQIEYPEGLQKFLSETPDGSSSKQKERLQKQHEGLKKQVIESRMALQRAERQICEKNQDLRAKLAECEDVLKEAKGELTDAEGRIKQIQGNLPLIYKDLRDPLAAQLHYVAELILNQKSENWLAFGALLKENTGITLRNPPSKEDIDKELSAYLSSLILLAHNDRVPKFAGFLDLIHWKEETLELDAKLTRVIKANEALQQERQKKEKLQEKCATYKQQRDEIKKDMEDNGDALARLRIETEKHRALVAEHASKVAEWKSISTSILSCDEKKKPEDIRKDKDIGEKQKELESLQLVISEIEKARDQVNLAVLKIREDREAYEEKNKAQHGMIGAFRTAQKELKALETNLSSFISRIPKTCPLSEHGQVSEKLNEFFLECDQQLETILPSGFPEDPLYRVAMSYQGWKGAYTPLPEWEGLQRKTDVYTSATFKDPEALKETYN